jgi:putative PIG3 family NAD(P)H quinone oxidoreductase
MTLTRVVAIARPGGPEVLRVRTRELADPGPGELLVQVHAAGLNRGDVLQRRGLYPAPPGVVPDVPGLEYSGRVVSAGPPAGDADALTWRPGDAVMGIVAGGAMATHLLVRADHALGVPAGLDLDEAAAAPEAWITAWDALLRQGALVPDEVVLIHAVTSGVGTAALQIAAASGAVVVGTGRDADKLGRCRTLEIRHGLQHAVQVQDGEFADEVRAAAGGRGADVILDLVGAAYLGENVKALARGGRLVVVGLLGGKRGELPLAPLLSKRARVIGTVLRSRSDGEKADLCRDFAREVLPGFAEGAFAPVVDSVMPMTDVAAAHARLERGDHLGKIVLRWD